MLEVSALTLPLSLSLCVLVCVRKVKMVLMMKAELFLLGFIGRALEKKDGKIIVYKKLVK